MPRPKEPRFPVNRWLGGHVHVHFIFIKNFKNFFPDIFSLIISCLLVGPKNVVHKCEKMKIETVHKL
jgi:hypothetical protein